MLVLFVAVNLIVLRGSKQAAYQLISTCLDSFCAVELQL